MDGAAAHAYARIQRLLLDMQAGKRRQERGMDVDLPSRPVLRKPRTLDPQEAGQRHELDAMLFKGGRDIPVERLAVGIGAMRAHHRGQAGLACDLEARGILPVADDAGDLGGIVGGLGGTDQRGHVGAAARYEDPDLQLRHRLSACSTTQSASAVGARSITPISLTVSPVSWSALATRTASAFAATTIMPRPQLKVSSMSFVGTLPTARSQRKTGGTVHCRASSRARRPSGRQRGTLPGRPPPVMCANPLRAPVDRIAASTCFT